MKMPFRRKCQQQSEKSKKSKFHFKFPLEHTCQLARATQLRSAQVVIQSGDSGQFPLETLKAPLVKV